MTVYIIGLIDVQDPEGYPTYSRQVSVTLEPHGGQFLVRGGQPEALEGTAPERVVVLAFPSAEHARAWYESEGYSRIRPLRQEMATGQLILAHGVDAPS
ncbi:hypothetical protein DAETH_08030 [Deinococcus aetherius]|uniref:DUF1330 domain-containing protein n=1 Tax=Deinococcus aetherius TaxID=200252 RepID=A0ABM8AAN6_9DEIO|nr:DUF1330 domain-containing protein [Deinococcus aetherius]BDP40834.1 hypothetical protein DAETH_08030 [Deinococcus aetherius]